MKPIGFIFSPYKDKFGTPRQPGLVHEIWSKVKIDQQWQPEESLSGLETFSHVWLIWDFHANTNLRFHSKVQPPRLEGRKQGVFATRSPHRPNPIGLSLVKLEKVDLDGIWVSGADLIDQTPIFDIKPYLPHIEAPPEASSGWVESVPEKDLEVTWQAQALQKLEGWKQKALYPQINETIEAVLKLDPRPLAYKDTPEELEKRSIRAQHAVRLYDLDIHFRFKTEKDIEIFDILFLNS